MADTEEPQFNSLKERIAALNKQKNFNGTDTVRKPAPPPVPGSTRSQTAPIIPSSNGPRPTPSVPQRPVKTPKPTPPPLPRRDTQTSLGETPQEERRAPPPLPGRTNSSQSAAPALPRRTSTQLLAPNERRGSASSEISQRSTASTISQAKTVSSVTSQGSDGRKLPPTFNAATLPPLPPTRREREAREQEEAAQISAKFKPPLLSNKSAPAVNVTTTTPTPKPSLPPRLPSRTSTNNVNQQKADPPLPSRPENQQQTALKSASIMGFGSAGAKVKSNNHEPTKIMGFGSGGGKFRPKSQANKSLEDENPPPLPSTARDDNTPPPVPVASRPTALQIDAANARVGARAEAREDCFTCRDWSEPDRVAAQFPRQTLPRNDPVGYLANGLCAPFQSYTDKARAIFTWFHHNIAYDTVSFFGNNVKHMKVEDTIFTGLAVCQGYAETYKAIANRAGLECVVVGGHGKGFGYTPLKQGEPCPPAKPDGHAWNAVRIDGGRWKLLDACWGAGHLDGATNGYKQKFSAQEFNRTNEQFGASHFPRESRYQFREDGRTVSWEEYFLGRSGGSEPVKVFGDCANEGILESSVEPRNMHIPVHSGQVVRFQFSTLCEHWQPEKHGRGKAPLLLLKIHGRDGRKDDMVPFETDGYWYWVDVNAYDLGAPGQEVTVLQPTTVGGVEARGMTAKDWYAKKGKGWGSSAVHMKWELV